jgi:hypothetical protein
MTKDELASAIRAAVLPSPARGFGVRGRLCLAAVLGQARRSEGLILPIVVVALAAVLGGAMPLAVYGMGPQPIEKVELLAPASNSGGPYAAPVVALSAGERGQPAEQRRHEHGGSLSGSGLQAAVAPPTKHNTFSSQEVVRSSSPAASNHGSEADASKPPAEPAAVSDQGDGSSVPASHEEEGQRSTGASAKVTLCHKPGSKKGGVTITVSEEAVPEHLAHGDTVGACREN